MFHSYILIISNNKPKEQISFPAFKFNDLVNEKWEDSKIYNLLEKKFLFVFFKIDSNGELKLSKVRFWNMPFKDREEVKEVWLKTKKVILSGEIVNSTKVNKNGKLIRNTNFPNKKSNKVAHVRPHALNSEDTYPFPVTDKFTQSNSYTKQCFWLNSEYVRDEIYLKFILNILSFHNYNNTSHLSLKSSTLIINPSTGKYKNNKKFFLDIQE